MDEKKDSEKFLNIGKAGNFTKNAVENFEENIVNKNNYLEEIKDNKNLH